ncbi:amidase family protein [Sphingomonas sp. NFX23]|uniref:amidase family protein n=1 Tax=Sphingomonas sp. NFX23 TaxID=2819532 RepID=UPI003CF22CE9
MERSALQTAAAIRAGETTALAACDAAIARIEARDGAINAVVIRDFARAREAARALDAEGPDDRPLFGVPMTVKESFDVAGLPTSWGVGVHRDNIVDRDAVAVTRLKAAGAVILGKTNVPVRLSDWQADNPIHGRTNHPLDPTLTPGGSSGGAAAALASGMVPLELGSDIGGSIRVPAAFCGVWGHKPTYGALSDLGHRVPGTDGASAALGVIGPLARNPEDLAVALDILADIPLPRATVDLARPRILLLTAHPSARVDSSIIGAIERVGEALAAAGATISSARPPIDLAAQHADYMRMLGIAMTRGGPARDGKVATLSHWFDLLDSQARLQRAWSLLFERFDAVIAPASGVNAFPHIAERNVARRTLTIDGEDTRSASSSPGRGSPPSPTCPRPACPSGSTRAACRSACRSSPTVTATTTRSPSPRCAID